MSGDPSDELTPADRELLRDLGAVLERVAPLPPDVVRAAKGLFTWRTVDAELAAVAYDSVLDDPADGLAAVRSAAGPRIVTFEAGELTVEVEVDDRPGGRRLVGQLVPARPAALELRRAPGDPTGAISGAISTATADELGRFRLALPREVALVRVRVTLADGHVVESAALRL